jgi:hypothetical protein
MSDVPELRASDADRERAIKALRDHLAEGRLTLEEFTDRMSAAALARTTGELEELVRDLPAPEEPVRPGSRRSLTKVLFSMFGSTEREGRIRVGSRLVALTAFGNIDLDLRHATLEAEVVTIVAVGMFGAVDVYVPEGVEVDLHGFALFGHKGARGNDPPPTPGTPLVRVYALSVFAGIDVWRVPIAWKAKRIGEVIKGIESGKHKAPTR